MSNIIKELQKELRAKGNKQLAEKSKRFFKEPVNFYGFKSEDVNKISKHYYNKYLKNYFKKEIFVFCEELWQSGMFEECAIACNWAYAVKEYYAKDDIDIFEKWLNSYVNNWASCDTLCNHTVGDFLEMFPAQVCRLKEWAKSENRWVKRGAAVSLIIPARKGLFLDEVFEIADILLEDPDDLVQKGYGWMLKAASEADAKAVFLYVNKNKDIMPRTSLRYAIEKMPPDLKKKAMD